MNLVQIINDEDYRASTLKDKLIQPNGLHVSIMDHIYDAGFICASCTVPLDDALKLLSQLQTEINVDPQIIILQKAAKILRADAKLCKI